MPLPHIEVDDVLSNLRVVELPLVTTFRRVTSREVAFIEGPQGWAEFAPFVEYADEEAATWLHGAFESAWLPAPAARRDGVEVNATVPAVDADDVPGVLKRFDGCTTVKVKVAEPGQEANDDYRRVSAVRSVLGDAGQIRVDANGAWSVDTAVEMLTRLAPLGLQYAEQPCATTNELADLRGRLRDAGVEVLVAADESVRKASDPLAVARQGAADVVVVKVAPLGGVRSAVRIADTVSRDYGLPTVFSSALDSSVGLARAVQAAAAVQDLPFACGLGTASLLADDVCSPPLVPHAGVLSVADASRAAGCPDLGAVSALAVSSARFGWWRDRVCRCVEVLYDTGKLP